MKSNLKSIILLIAIVLTSLMMMSCTGTSKIPQDPERAKKVVERNKRQIDAIVSFHGLKSPFIKLDTVIFNIPERSASFLVPPSIPGGIQSAINTSIEPFIIQGKEEKVKEIVRNVVLQSHIDYTYVDENIGIHVFGPVDSLSVTYNIHEINKEKVISNELYDIDTRVRWYEQSSVRMFLFLLSISLLIIAVNYIIKKNQTK